MNRIDLVKLRKAAGMSQRELADKLSVRQSFLSAIENGRSRMPDEKIDRLKDIFGLDDLSMYLIDEKNDAVAVPPHTHLGDEGTDAITLLLKHIHAQAHQSDNAMSNTERTELEDRVSYLTSRNDRLSDRVDELREQVDSLREENFRLKELLTRNGIDY